MTNDTDDVTGDASLIIYQILQTFPDRSYVEAKGDIPDDDEIIEFIHTDHFRTARMNFANWVLFEGAAARSSDSKENAVASHQAQSFRLGAIVFAATSLEAAINYYAKKHTIRFSRDYEKTMSTLAKWQIYPEQVSGQHLADHILGHVKRIFQLRDRIVHPKPSWTSIAKLQQIPLFGPSQGAFMMNIASDAMVSLFPDEDTSFVGDKFPNAHDWEKNCFIP
ncbi:hypothetical protein [Crateriforma conspicua]|uniref:HEPN AbiU2-like domain-containing protein n=1 Tax=Crateriforma conspicua TaxID=2527996 RepID=A0A5C5YAV3_9PLAN|nr:hypothetical protein [Crateriforma conspicua]TWT72099.1 hypothetical protein Pan14r_44160 [Crateriforma conspicua]